MYECPFMDTFRNVNMQKADMKENMHNFWYAIGSHPDWKIKYR